MMPRTLRHLATLLFQAFLVLLALWSLGAGLGVITVGYCSVAGC